MNSFFNKFAPKQHKFFNFLEDLTEALTEAAALLAESVDASPSERGGYYKRIKDVERRGDQITHKIMDELEKAFATPIDRVDINQLAAAIDDVIDGVNSSAKRINIYNPKVLGTSAKELCSLIKQGAACISKAVDELETFRKNPSKVRLCCVELHDMETKGDDVYEHFIKKLFEEEKDAVELIKQKEIMYELERTTDAAEHVGKILKNLVVKYV